MSSSAGPAERGCEGDRRQASCGWLGHNEFIKRLGSGKALELLGANGLNHEIVPVSFPQCILRLLRQKDLSPASDRANPDRMMHVETDVSPIEERRRARMYAHSNL